MSIRTRFAPSPTGYLHIGGVRTALFNWLLTKRLGGQFVLRIDDTDTERNRPEALQPILDGFRWLGIQWDEGPEVGGPYGPYFQSQRSDLYKQAALKLLETGHAYPDYMTKEERDADRMDQCLKRYLSSNPKATDEDIAKERKAIESGQRNYVHRGPHRNTPIAECIKLFQDKPTTLRFKIPEGTKAAFKDLICGDVEQNTNTVGDPVILRENGTALYNFASVVDDGAMEITHIIRAREHLANTYTQYWFFQALGLPLPHFAHVPVVNEPASKPNTPKEFQTSSKKKLSKRDMKKFVTPDIRNKLRAIGWTDEQIDSRDDLNPATVAFYQEMGYLPTGLVNYLGRLGWSMDATSEIIKLPEMIANFGLERVNDSPASFDPDKLYWVAGEYMKDLPMQDKIAGCIPFLERAGYIAPNPDGAIKQKLQRIIEACKDRLKLFSDILPYGGPFFKADPSYDPKAIEKFLKKAGAIDLLKEFVVALQANDVWDAPTLDKVLHEFCTTKGIKPKDLVQPVRVAVTGNEVGVGLFDTLAILGKDETLRRIDLAFKQVIG